MKAVSVSAELAVIQRAVQGVADRLDVETVDGPVTEEHQRQATAILNLVACRLRDLGRAARGSINADMFWTAYNAPVEGFEGEDVILYPAPPPTRPKK